MEGAKRCDEMCKFSALLLLLYKEMHQSLDTLVRAVPWYRFIRVSNRLQQNRSYAPRNISPRILPRADHLEAVDVFTAYQVNIYHGHSCCATNLPAL